MKDIKSLASINRPSKDNKKIRKDNIYVGGLSNNLNEHDIFEDTFLYVYFLYQ
jgi:hypothetical protein